MHGCALAHGQMNASRFKDQHERPDAGAEQVAQASPNAKNVDIAPVQGPTIEIATPEAGHEKSEARSAKNSLAAACQTRVGREPPTYWSRTRRKGSGSRPWASSEPARVYNTRLRETVQVPKACSPEVLAFSTN